MAIHAAREPLLLVQGKCSVHVSSLCFQLSLCRLSTTLAFAVLSILSLPTDLFAHTSLSAFVL